MNKTVMIVVALAAGALLGGLALMRGESPTPSRVPLAPNDMREHNRNEIADMLTASRERGEEARRKSARTERILQLERKRGHGEASAADVAELDRLRREEAEEQPATRPATTATRTSTPP